MRILAISDVHGSTDLLERLAERSRRERPDVVVFSGDIVRGYARGNEWLAAQGTYRVPNRGKPESLEEEAEDLQLYREFYEATDSLGVPVLVIPGNMDAPEPRFFSVALNQILSSPNIHLAQENLVKIGLWLFCGFGGITEDEREKFFVLRYPRWEVEFALRWLRYAEVNLVLLFHTPTIGRLDLEGEEHRGSRVVNDLIAAIRPRLAFCGHGHRCRGTEWIGQTLVVNPGVFKYGNFAVVNTDTMQVQFHAV